MDFTAQIINMEIGLNHKTQERKIKSYQPRFISG